MKALRIILIVAGASILIPLLVAFFGLRDSLPRLQGTVRVAGLSAPVSIERDALGVPTLTAANRADLAYGLGFVHGQDRFFEMDLSRRLAAGELSELFGAIAVEQDSKARLFRFRAVARAGLQLGSPQQRQVLEAYAKGVNAGLASLGSRPWEYWVLGSAPVPWRPEDTFLVSHAMWWDLQYSGIDREILRRDIDAQLGAPRCEDGWSCRIQSLYPAGTEWDAPNAQTGIANPGTPGSPVRPGEAHATQAATGGRVPSLARVPIRTVDPFTALTGIGASSGEDIGSNNWAVAGRLTESGAALVANDMHLHARVPATWYRARLQIPSTGAQPSLELTGVTLPGAPVLVAGSNGHIAWGFTNSYGTWISVQRVACTAVADDAIRTATESIALSSVREEIRVHGKPSAWLTVRTGPAGVLYESRPEAGSCWFVSWVAQQPAATNMNLLAVERATSVAEALAIAPTVGIPHQNFVIGDREGHIAWTIAGRVPVDSGSNRAVGQPLWTTEAGHPRIVDPEAGRIWSANARATDDPAQQIIVGGVDARVGADYDLGARAHQIREDLLAIPGKASPADMLRIQLDDRAVFLTRWRDLLLNILDDAALRGDAGRAEFRKLVEGWNARASTDSVGYRLVRTFHERIRQSAWEMTVAAMKLHIPRDTEAPSQFEGVLWRLVSEQPAQMLDSQYRDWRQFLLVQLDATLGELHAACRTLVTCTWGSQRPVAIRHPLSKALPFGSALLDMPTVQLPGDHDMPRVQEGPDGASERFAVSPGHEAQGYIHLPGGQSGHPLSPYYRAGFMNWVNGTPLPFLPGPSQHLLTLQPD